MNESARVAVDFLLSKRAKGTLTGDDFHVAHHMLDGTDAAAADFAEKVREHKLDSSTPQGPAR